MHCVKYWPALECGYLPHLQHQCMCFPSHTSCFLCCNLLFLCFKCRDLAPWAMAGEEKCIICSGNT